MEEEKEDEERVRRVRACTADLDAIRFEVDGARSGSGGWEDGRMDDERMRGWEEARWKMEVGDNCTNIP
jgi:hypothetical protein